MHPAPTYGISSHIFILLVLQRIKNCNCPPKYLTWRGVSTYRHGYASFASLFGREAFPKSLATMNDNAPNDDGDGTRTRICRKTRRDSPVQNQFCYTTKYPNLQRVDPLWAFSSQHFQMSSDPFHNDEKGSPSTSSPVPTSHFTFLTKKQSKTAPSWEAMGAKLLVC